MYHPDVVKLGASGVVIFQGILIQLKIEGEKILIFFLLKSTNCDWLDLLGLKIEALILSTILKIKPYKHFLMHVYLAVYSRPKRFLMFLKPYIKYIHSSHEDKFPFRVILWSSILSNVQICIFT